MIIAAAQLYEDQQEIDYKINKHLQLIERAASCGAQLIAFPEMSLTGYHTNPGESLILEPGDSRLDIFRQKASHHNMIIVAGAPFRRGNKLFIGSFIFLPGGHTEIYSKQNLDAAETVYYTASDRYNPLVANGNETLSFSICADITNPLHPSFAKKSKATLYIASIFYSKKAIDEGCGQLRKHASRYSLNVLMSNYASMGYPSIAAGKSSFWSSGAHLLGQLGGDTEGLLLVKLAGGHPAEYIGLDI